MKNKLSGLLILPFVMAAPACFAQTATTTTTTTVEETSTTDHPWEFSIQGQGVFPVADDADRRFDTTAGGAARIMRDITPTMALGVEGGWIRYKDEVGGLKYGRLHGFPVLADVELKMPIEATHNTIVPYLIAGAGVMFWNYEENDAAQASGIKVDNDSDFAAKGGAGVDFYLNDRMAVFVEGTYLYSRFEPDVSGPVAALGDKTNTGSVLAGAGFKLKF
jgi:opacity protein-like surface antigen